MLVCFDMTYRYEIDTVRCGQYGVVRHSMGIGVSLQPLIATLCLQMLHSFESTPFFSPSIYESQREENDLLIYTVKHMPSTQNPQIPPDPSIPVAI